MTQTYEYRFYPTVAQAAELSRTFGCVRLVYNKALDARATAWAHDQRHVTYGDTSAKLTQSAFNHFFARRAPHTRFKSRGRQARAMSDASWSQLRSMLEHKAAWYGREVIAIDRWFPSSKAYSACGALTGSMPLSVRTWAYRCGAIHDRDVNAAKNVLAAGLAVTACGDGAGPTRHEPVRQPSRPPRKG